MEGRTILDSLMHKLPSTRKYYRISLIVPDNGIPVIEYHQAVTNKKPRKCINFVDLLFADKKHDMNQKHAFSIYTTDKTVTFLAKDETTINEWLTKIKECHSNLYPEFKRYDAIFEANLLDKGLAKTMNLHGVYRLALCKDSLDLIPLITPNMNLQTRLHAPFNNTPNTTTTGLGFTTTTTTTTTPASPSLSTSTTATTTSTTGALTNAPSALTTTPNLFLHHHHHHHHLFETPKLTARGSGPLPMHSIINPLSLNTSAITPHLNHLHLPQHLPTHQRFHKRHPLLSLNTIELVLRSIRRCGHTDCNFYIESGRHSQIGEGDLWMSLSKKSTARHLHELLLATMKLASSSEDQFLYKTPRSRSGSSSEATHRSQQSRAPSLLCLSNNEQPQSALVGTATATATMVVNNNKINNTNTPQVNLNTITTPTTTNTISTIPVLSNNNNIEEDSGYLPMA